MRRENLEDALGHEQDRDVERAAAKVNTAICSFIAGTNTIEPSRRG